MEAKIVKCPEKKLVGLSQSNSIIKDITPVLWSRFMPRLKEITHRHGNELYNLQMYTADHFRNYDPARVFTAWVLAEVTEHKEIPEGMSAFTIPAGQYAVFLHKGGPKTAMETFQQIFNVWLPQSAYQLAQRPHFEVLGEKYSNSDPESEEEVWLPVIPH